MEPSKPPATYRDRAATRRAARQTRVAELRAAGRSVRDIALELGVTHVTIIRDIREIEDRAGAPIDVDFISGMDGKYYLPKVTVQEYEETPGFGELTPDDDADDVALSAVDHLSNALADLQRAEDALQASGARDPDVPGRLAELRHAAAAVLHTNKALPRRRPDADDQQQQEES